MDWSLSREVDSSLGSKEMSRILYNRKLHHRLCNSPPLVPLLGNINPLYAHRYHFFEIYFNVTPPQSLSFKWSLPKCPIKTKPKETQHLPSRSTYKISIKYKNLMKNSSNMYIHM